MKTKMNEATEIGIDNIRRINFDKLEQDFSFIVNGEIYKTNSLVANVLSPRISNMFEQNSEISYYEINTQYEGDFNRILEYGELKTINVQPNEKRYFRNVMRQLENNDEALRFSKELQERISDENVIQRIEIKKELNINFNEEIAFLASHFHIFLSEYSEEISNLDVDTIEQIISDQNLKLYNEEELFDIILNLYIKSKKYSPLFSHIIFINLKAKSLQDFYQNFDINDMNKSIWDSIFCRLEQDISDKSLDKYKQSNQEFLENRYLGKRHEHIIRHLSKQCHGNVHRKNVIRVTPSSKDKMHDVENIVEQNDSHFATKNESNSWVKFDFKERKVLLDSYTLISPEWEPNDFHLKSWILEVSNDDQNYIEIDRHEDCNLLNGSLYRETFEVSCSIPQRYIRLRQIGPNWCGFNNLVINSIEFSGYLYEFINYS